LKKVVSLNPKYPPDVWLSIWIVYLKINNLPKAPFALENVLELDSKNAIAMTALGICELQINFADKE